MPYFTPFLNESQLSSVRPGMASCVLCTARGCAFEESLPKQAVSEILIHFSFPFAAMHARSLSTTRHSPRNPIPPPHAAMPTHNTVWLLTSSHYWLGSESLFFLQYLLAPHSRAHCDDAPSTPKRGKRGAATWPLYTNGRGEPASVWRDFWACITG